MFSADNEERLGHSVFQSYYRIKQSMWVSNNFKAALDYSSLYIDQYIFDVMILLWTNNFNRKVQ